MARTLEELLQQEKPEVVEAAKDKAEKILRELEGVDQDTPQDELDEPADNHSSGSS
ncbi:hypothetical protein ACOQKP_13390 [Klebsiella pneumoniae]|nr:MULTISPECIES: hypothetical protein [Gammaproteobacteria]EHW4160821.1 hypothetical protein [Salmonella enterica subsp. enterica serovar Kentucky]EIV2090849.1 hypothetical protein [Klebsiella pneumoniae subsp. ozaenae]EJE8479374.1 hypothetical protein [Shigella sonnei]EKU4002031.1 hypothetical protein [Morganella morganii]MCU3340854.1 hypothetical protein [Enterobacter hormaechei subsp. hoffmannii]MCZ8787239.1 hypothetical protein [Escherichia albertii]USA26850.1 hypothetical protein NBG90_